MGVVARHCPACGVLNPAVAEACEVCHAPLKASSPVLNAAIACLGALIGAQVYGLMQQPSPPPAPPPVVRRAVLRPRHDEREQAPAPTGYTLDDVDEAIRDAEKRVGQLSEGVLVMPLLDAKGTTTALGSTLAVLGMQHAMFVPQRKTYGSLPAALALYAKRGWFKPGAVPDADSTAVTRATGTKWVARGSLTSDGRVLALELTVQGPGKPVHERCTVPADAPERAVSWIAAQVHRALGLTLTPAEARVRDGAPGIDAGCVERLTRLECGTDRAATFKDFETLLARAPVADLVLERALMLVREKAAADGMLSRARSEAAGHTLVDLARARVASQNRRVLESVPLELTLLATEHRDRGLYELLDTDLWATDRLESLAHVYAFWNRVVQGEAAPHLLEGAFFTRWAWKDREAGLRDAAGPMLAAATAHFRQAQVSLKAAWALDQHDLMIPLALLFTTVGLGEKRAAMEEWYEHGHAIDPHSYLLARAKLTYLMPRWHGTEAEMMEFARQSATGAAQGSAAALVLWDAHRELAARSPKKDAYYRGAPYTELSSMFEALGRSGPPRLEAANRYAQVAFRAQEYSTAAHQFDAVGARWDREVWKDQSEFDNAREASYELSREQPVERLRSPTSYDSETRNFRLLYMEW